MKRLFKLNLILAFAIIFSSQAFAQKKKKYDPERAQETIEAFNEVDPGLKEFFDNSFGYAVFPSIGKGAIGIGGAAGKGVVFKSKEVAGGVKMTQVSIGFQLGGQSYSEVIFFEDEAAYTRFIENEFEFAAQVSAVALKSGVSADAKYTDGVAVFTMANGGLMYEASVGGQRFKFVPKNKMK